MRALARYITALQFIRILDVRTVAKRASDRGTIRYDFAHLQFRIRVPFWKVWAVRREIRNSLSIPVTTVCRVRALSLRDHFRVREFRIYQ
jgi:hypothetical protein